MTKYDNSGSLSKNDRKEKATHPDVKGKATINGVEYWLDGWKKEGERGTWYSLSFKLKDGEPAKNKPAKNDAPDDEIPW